MLSVFNLGIGGSLVTPLTEAIAKQNKREQAVLVQAGLGPLIIACIVGAVLVIPTVALLPLSTLFGRVGATGSWDLRVAVVIAVSMTLATIPLNAVGYLRQAYQEMHLTNLIATGFNILLLIALLVAARRSKAIVVFVTIVLIIPLCNSALNFVLLMVQRPFLLRRQQRIGWGERRRFRACILFSMAGVLGSQNPVGHHQFLVCDLHAGHYSSAEFRIRVYATAVVFDRRCPCQRGSPLD
jgi:hypothetical protein